MAEEKSSLITISISTSSIVKILIFLFVLWFLYLIRDIIVIIFIAIFLTSIFEPIVNFLQKKKVPRSLGIIIIYLVIFLLFSLTLLLLIPPLIDQFGQLARTFPFYWEKIVGGIKSLQEYSESHGYLDNIEAGLHSLQTSFAQSASNIFSFITTIFGNIISFILVLVLTFYFLLQENTIKKTFKQLTPPKYQPYLVDLISRIQYRLSLWLRGELALGLIVGTLSLIGFFVLGLKYYLILALIAGIFELIPYIGPTLAAIPAIFFAFMDSPIKGIAVIILCWLIQQTENHIIVPKVMQKAVGLNPIIIIIVILIGFRLAGFIGVLLAVPTATALSVVFRDFFESSEFVNFSKKEVKGD